MPPSKSDILPSEGGITPMWALACGKYGIQGASAPWMTFSGAPSAPTRAPPKLTEGHLPSVPPLWVRPCVHQLLENQVKTGNPASCFQTPESAAQFDETQTIISNYNAILLQYYTNYNTTHHRLGGGRIRPPPLGFSGITSSFITVST